MKIFKYISAFGLLAVSKSDQCLTRYEDKLEVQLTPSDNFSDIILKVYRLHVDGTIDRLVLRQNKYVQSVSDQSSSRCLVNTFCYKAVIMDKGGDELCCEDGQASYYKVFWDDKLIKDEKFLGGSEDAVTYFGNCPTFSPSISHAPSIISAMPTSIPSLSPRPTASISFAPSPVPSLSLVPTETCIHNKEEFELLMSPGNDNFGNIRFCVFRLHNGRSRKVFAKNEYFDATPNQSSSKCLYTRFCYMLVVADKRHTMANRGRNQDGQSTYKAYWNGVLIQDGKVGESEVYFGNCPTANPSISPNPTTTSRSPIKSPSYVLSTLPLASNLDVKPFKTVTCEKSLHGYRNRNVSPFQILINTGSNKPRNIYLHVLRRNDSGQFKTFAFRKSFLNSTDDVQETVRCFWNNYCLKAIVYNRSGTGFADVSLTAYWRGSPISFDYASASESSVVSEEFGKC